MFAHEQAFLQALQGQSAALEQLSTSPQFLQRLSIYQTSILSTLQQALYKNFKPLQALIGKEAFQELCYRYAISHLSTELNLSRYGADLHVFIETAPFAATLPYLSDFIEFCFIWRQTYLQASMGLTLIESLYPLYEIWQRCQPEFSGAAEITNWQGPFYFALYREHNRVIVQSYSSSTKPSLMLEHNLNVDPQDSYKL